MKVGWRMREKVTGWRWQSGTCSEMTQHSIGLNDAANAHKHTLTTAFVCWLLAWGLLSVSNFETEAKISHRFLKQPWVPCCIILGSEPSGLTQRIFFSYLADVIEVRPEVGCTGAVEADGQWKLDVTLLLYHRRKQKRAALTAELWLSGKWAVQLQQCCCQG